MLTSRQSGTTRGWTRHGECNQCGACCQILVQALPVRLVPEVQEAAYWRARGFPLRPGGTIDVTGTLVAPCPQLTATLGCRLHGTAEKPSWCQSYPTGPEQIAAFPCSYWFTRDGEAWGGQASPYPVRAKIAG